MDEISESPVRELLDLTQQLLEAIATDNWEVYHALCDPTLSAFEPEARGQLVEGMEFHRFYFRLTETKTRRNTTMTTPRVRLLGEDAAVVTYVRLTQYLDASGNPQTSRFEETRIWQRQDGIWRHVHFHRSANS